MSSSLHVVLGFIAWTLFLLILMESVRSWLVVSGKVPANGFNPENSNLSPFMQRLARAHANCLEGLPLFGGLLVVAVLADRSHLTDPLAYTLLGARVVVNFVDHDIRNNNRCTLTGTCSSYHIVDCVGQTVVACIANDQA